ncbi:MAG: acetyltransferase [Microvirga sp.]|nr:acetyltransferase [Microvirga sp.]
MRNLPENNIGFARPSEAAIVGGLIRAMDQYYRPGEDLLPETDYAAMVAQTLEQQEGTRFLLDPSD